MGVLGWLLSDELEGSGHGDVGDIEGDFDFAVVGGDIEVEGERGGVGLLGRAVGDVDFEGVCVSGAGVHVSLVNGAVFGIEYASGLKSFEDSLSRGGLDGTSDGESYDVGIFAALQFWDVEIFGSDFDAKRAVFDVDFDGVELGEIGNGDLLHA